MNEEIRLAWTDRLRDHTQPQGTGRLWLPDSDIHDVWGHLCEVAVEMTQNHSLISADLARYGYYCFDIDRVHVRYPPKSVLKWAEIDPEAGPSSDIVLHLSARNDNSSNFPFLAEEIDQYLG